MSEDTSERTYSQAAIDGCVQNREFQLLSSLRAATGLDPDKALSFEQLCLKLDGILRDLTDANQQLAEQARAADERADKANKGAVAREDELANQLGAVLEIDTDGRHDWTPLLTVAASNLKKIGEQRDQIRDLNRANEKLTIETQQQQETITLQQKMIQDQDGGDGELATLTMLRAELEALKAELQSYPFDMLRDAMNRSGYIWTDLVDVPLAQRAAQHIDALARLANKAEDLGPLKEVLLVTGYQWGDPGHVRPYIDRVTEHVKGLHAALERARKYGQEQKEKKKAYRKELRGLRERFSVLGLEPDAFNAFLLTLGEILEIPDATTKPGELLAKAQELMVESIRGGDASPSADAIRDGIRITGHGYLLDAKPQKPLKAIALSVLLDLHRQAQVSQKTIHEERAGRQSAEGQLDNIVGALGHTNPDHTPHQAVLALVKDRDEWKRKYGEVTELRDRERCDGQEALDRARDAEESARAKLAKVDEERAALDSFLTELFELAQILDVSSDVKAELDKGATRQEFVRYALADLAAQADQTRLHIQQDDVALRRLVNDVCEKCRFPKPTGASWTSVAIIRTAVNALRDERDHWLTMFNALADARSSPDGGQSLFFTREQLHALDLDLMRLGHTSINRTDGIVATVRHAARNVNVLRFEYAGQPVPAPLGCPACGQFVDAPKEDGFQVNHWLDANGEHLCPGSGHRTDETWLDVARRADRWQQDAEGIQESLDHASHTLKNAQDDLMKETLKRQDAEAKAAKVQAEFNEWKNAIQSALGRQLMKNWPALNWWADRITELRGEAAMARRELEEAKRQLQKEGEGAKAARRHAEEDAAYHLGDALGWKSDDPRGWTIMLNTVRHYRNLHAAALQEAARASIQMEATLDSLKGPENAARAPEGATVAPVLIRAGVHRVDFEAEAPGEKDARVDIVCTQAAAAEIMAFLLTPEGRKP